MSYFNFWTEPSTLIILLTNFVNHVVDIKNVTDILSWRPK